MAARPRTNFGTVQDDDAQYVMSRVAYLTTQYYNFGIEHQEIADHIIPRKNSILIQRVPGWKRTQRLFDSTAPDAADKLAASIHGTLTSPYIQWFSLETEDPALNAIPEVAAYLQECAARMRAQFNKSNFAQESHELYLDLVTFGTGCLFFEQKESDEKGFFGGFNFKSVNVGKFLLAEGPDGRVNAVFRVFPLSAQAVAKQFLSKSQDAGELKKILDASKPDKPFSVIHAVYPETKGGMVDNKWKSIYLLEKGKLVLSKDGFREFPYMAPRWSKVSDETYGRGPSHTALPDIRSLNKIVELELRAMALRVQPPMASRNGDTIGPIRLVPGGHTTVRGDKDSIWAIEMGGDFQVVNLKKQELVESIRRIYYYDQLQLPQGPQMTAEEVVTRMELMERLMGPAVGRLESEFLRPGIDRAWGIMWRANQASPGENILPPMPAELQNAMTQRKIPLRIRFEGPLARAQKSADATAIQGLAGFLAQTIVPFKPDVVDVFDWDELAREYASVKGVPAKGIVNPEQVAEQRQQRQQQQQAQQAAAEMAEGAKAAGSAAPMVKAMQNKPEDGSAMMNGLQGALNMGGMNNAPTG